MNENVDIFVYSHIPFKPKVKNPVYKILTHTNEEIDTKLPVYRDYEGDNIGDKNLIYNEYTGLYWVWKNYDLKDYIGLNHYNRYYDFLDNVPNIEQILNISSIILNEPFPLKVNYGDSTAMKNRQWFAFWHNIEDYDKFIDFMKRNYPEYNDGLKKMDESNFIFPSSMFIMKKETFLEYCDFIFNVLKGYMQEFNYNTVEECINNVENNKDKYIKPHLPYYTVEKQARIVGYIAERALQVFLMNGENSLYKHSVYFKWHLIV